jgi:hypothetical protein
MTGKVVFFVCAWTGSGGWHGPPGHNRPLKDPTQIIKLNEALHATSALNRRSAFGGNVLQNYFHGQIEQY